MALRKQCECQASGLNTPSQIWCVCVTSGLCLMFGKSQRVKTWRACVFSVPRPTRICRASYLCLENWNGGGKIKNPLNSSIIFLQFSQFSEILGKSEKKKKNSSESVRTKIHTAENKGFYFLDFVRIRPYSSDFGKIEKNDFSNFFIFSHFLEIHFSWISTESDVLWCIGGPQGIRF